MKHYIIKSLLPFIIISLCISCEDYLDDKPKKLITLTRLSEFNDLLNSNIPSRTIGQYSPLLTDDVYLPDTDPNGNLALSTLIVQRQAFYKHEKELYPGGLTDTDWNYCYQSIFHHNVILGPHTGVLSAIDGTEAQKKALYGESLLARAFEFHQLVTLYAKAYNPNSLNDHPGIPLILVADASMKNLTRASVQEVYDRIITDVKEAIPMLTDKAHPTAFRGTNYAAKAFLSRVYLHQSNYEEALIYAEETISDLKKMGYQTLINLNDFNLVNPNATSGRSDVPARELNTESLYIKFTEAARTMSARAYVDFDLLALFDRDTDQRFKLYISDSYQGIQRAHYLWVPAMDANIGINSAEIYLNAAECNARLGNTDKAMEYLEELRKNRYEDHTVIPTAGLTQKEILKLILDERRRELMMIPGVRLADLKRLAFDPDFSQSVKRTIEGVTTIVAPTSNKLILAIPEIVIGFNPDMEQNSRED